MRLQRQFHRIGHLPNKDITIDIINKLFNVVLHFCGHDLFPGEKLILVVRNQYLWVSDLKIEPERNAFENELVFVVFGLFCTDVMIKIVRNLFEWDLLLHRGSLNVTGYFFHCEFVIKLSKRNGSLSVEKGWVLVFFEFLKIFRLHDDDSLDFFCKLLAKTIHSFHKVSESLSWLGNLFTELTEAFKDDLGFGTDELGLILVD